MLTLAILVVVVLVFPGPSAGEETPSDGSLLYASMVPADRDLHVVEDGTSRPLTDLPGLEYHAAPTPDGRSVVFTSEQGGDPDLWIVDLGGGEPRRLYDSDVFEDAAEVSPDGRHIAFVSARSGRAEIWLAEFPPKDEHSFDAARNLTPEEGSDFRPAFSPDGRWIAYSSTRGLPFAMGAGSHLWIVGVDPSAPAAAPRRLVAGDGWSGSPVWSADGESIAYHRLVPYPTDHPDLVAEASVWRVDVESGERRQLSQEGRYAAYPARHPEGGWVWAEKDKDGWRLVRHGEDGRVEAMGEETSGIAMPVVLGDGRVVGHGPEAASSAVPDTPTDMARTDMVRTEGVPDTLQTAVRLVPMLPPILAREQVHSHRLDDMTLDLLPLRTAFPALSPDRRTLATGAMSLMLLDLGSGVLRGEFRPGGVPDTFPSVWAPSWSPDGSWLTFTGGPGFGGVDAPVDVWRISSDGTGAVNLTAASAANDGMAEVSPDGRWIVFRSGRSGQQDLYLMNADGSDVRRLTKDPAVDTMPTFSPDGRRVAFASTRSGNHDVFVLALDETGRPAGEPQQITSEPGMDVHPRWSPDGSWLIVTTDRWGWNDELDFVSMNFQPYGELAAVNLGDGLVVRLTHNNWEEAQGSWVDVGLDEIFADKGASAESVSDTRSRCAPTASTAARR